MMAEPIRVAQVMGYMNGGGVESVVMNYYRHIDREKVQFDFIVCEGSMLVPQGEIESMGGRVFMVPGYKKIFQYLDRLTSLFRSEGWGIVHSHVNSLSVFPLYAAKRAGTPVRIAHSHATMGKGEPIRNLVKMALRPLSKRYPTDLAACSRHAGNWLFGERASFTVIPNAIEIDKYQFNETVRAEVRAAWGVESDCCVVGTVGRLESVKNQSFLIDAFKCLHDAHPKSLLIIAGSGSLRARLERRTKELDISDCVLFPGQVRDVSCLYQGMDVFTLPSLYEGFGMALLEAEVSGIPCVVSEQVPSEAILSESCRISSLEEGPAVFAAAMWDQYVSKMRIQPSLDGYAAFNIRCAASKLVDFYFELTRGRRQSSQSK